MKTKAKREKIRRLTIGLPWDVWRHYKRKSGEECRKVGPQIVVELRRAMAAEAADGAAAAKPRRSGEGDDGHKALDCGGGCGGRLGLAAGGVAGAAGGEG